MFHFSTPMKPVCAAAACALLAALGGCTTSESAGRMFVSPTKYQFYTCRDLAIVWSSVNGRRRELEKLMAQAGQDAGGKVVGAIAYQPEYANVSGDIYTIRQEAAAKQCTLPDANPPKR
jgi:hypothetical protein